MLYSFIRRCLFILDPERSHLFALETLKVAQKSGIAKLYPKPISKPQTIMGLQFPNRVGLAAGFDRNADYIDALATLGFGFIEIGTITPKPQTGNPKPRLFRLPQQEALINRMGFYGKGLDHAVKQLEHINYRGILGINIAKGKDTPNENAVDDYLLLFNSLWKYASYITLNVSSPNTQGLRDLQKADSLGDLLRALKAAQKEIEKNYKKYVPLVVKIAPDLSQNELHSIAEIFLQENIDGVIATNTTISRTGVLQETHSSETGGLSGRPLTARSTSVIKELQNVLQDRIPIIACGGIMDEKSAQEKLDAGAKLLQIYTGFIYQGPSLIPRLAKL